MAAPAWRSATFTLRNGNAGTAGNGGNLQALAGASVALTRVRLFNGRATRGGGLAISGAGGTNQLSISQSLIDGNVATGTTPADSGGGLYVEGATGDVAVSITESTITGNSAANGGGIGVANNSGTDPVLHGVTLTRNNARAGQVPGIGGIASPFTSARIQGSIIGGNTSTINLAAGQIQIAANCALRRRRRSTRAGTSATTSEPRAGSAASTPIRSWRRRSTARNRRC